MAGEPDSRRVRNGGASALLGALIARGCGSSLHDYAESRLFGPLGVRPSEWVRGRDGECLAASGLRRRPRDLAKVGRLGSRRRGWNGRRLVPADWLETLLRTHASTGELG